MSEWKEYKLGEVLEVKYGKDHKKLQDGKYPCFGSGGLMRFVDEYIYNEESILIPRKGSLNKIIYQDKPFWTVDTMFWTKIDLQRANPKYLFYQLTSTNFSTLNVGSAVPSLTVPVINGIKITLPPLKEQKAIASVLCCLDAKIENLRRQNETLEAIAQTLFKHWFIDFEFPNDDGKPYKSSGGEMRSSELGEIPKDWRVGKLEDEFKILMGQSPAGSSYNENQEGFIFYQGRTDFGFRFPTVRLYTTEPKRIAEKFDVLVSVRAPVGDINVAFEKCCIGRGLSAVKSQYKSYCLYKLKSYRKTFDIFETEGTVFGSLNKDNFNNLANIIPHSTIIIQFENITSSLDQKIFLNTKQIQILTKARDELIPKLMSGQLRVKG
jgi:type I restriction enzyme S subunit